MEERLEYFYNYYKNLMAGKWSEETLLQQAAIMANKEKTIKKGENVIHINYINGLITEDELFEIEHKVLDAGLELSSYDKAGVAYASFSELTGTIQVILSSKISHDIVIGAAGSGTWALLSLVLSGIYKKLRDRKFTKMSSGGHTEKKEATLSLVLKIGDNNIAEYNLVGTEENDTETAILFQNILKDAQNRAGDNEYKVTNVLQANFNNKSIEKINELEFIKNKAKEQSTKNKFNKPVYPKRKRKK